MTANLIYLNIVQIFILVIMSLLVYNNAHLTLKQKLVFILTFASIGIISIIEFLALYSANKGPSWRWGTFIFNLLGLGLSPFIPIIFAYAVSPNKQVKWPILVISIFDLFLLISIPFGLVFGVNEENVYTRGPLFYVFTSSYLVSILYLFYITFNIGLKYRNSNPLILYINFVFLLFGTFIQVLKPDVHVTWVAVTGLAIVYYAYCNNLWHQVDGLTQLLSQESYFADTKKLKNNGILVIFDIDKFKLINDTYGHSIGDEYLKTFSSKLREVYANDGFCYRIGGDEFLVILNENADVDRLNKAFEDSIKPYNENFATKPSVSYGVSRFTKNDNILQIKDLADERMYEEKRKHKKIIENED